MVQELALVLPRVPLTTLELDRTGLDDRGCQMIASMLPETSLATLNLSGNKIFDHGAEALLSVLAKTRLTTLDLKDNRITQAVDHVLAAWVRSSHLTTLLGDGYYALCPSLAWRRATAGCWSTARHASFPLPIRRIIATVLIVARSDNASTRTLACGLACASTQTLHLIFRWVARLNYFAV